jgi:hypothetical protein
MLASCVWTLHCQVSGTLHCQASGRSTARRLDAPLPGVWTLHCQVSGRSTAGCLDAPLPGVWTLHCQESECCTAGHLVSGRCMWTLHVEVVERISLVILSVDTGMLVLGEGRAPVQMDSLERRKIFGYSTSLTFQT